MGVSVQSLRAELQDQQRRLSIETWSAADQQMERPLATWIDSDGLEKSTINDGGWWFPHVGSGFLRVTNGDNPDADASEAEYIATWGAQQDEAERLVSMYLALMGLQHISEWRLWTPIGGVNRSGFDFKTGFTHGYYVPYGLTYDQAVQSYYYNARTGQKIVAYGQTPGGPILGELMRIEARETATVIFLDFDKQGLPIYRASMISKGDGFMEFLMIASFVFAPYIGGVIAPMVGEAIVGTSFAVAYPAVTNAIGQVVVNTVMSGGDIEGAVKGVALSYAGNVAGGYVQSGVTSTFDGAQWADGVGKAAGDLTKIAIKGGDPTMGLVNLAIKSGGTFMDWLNFDGDYTDTPPDTSYIPFDQTESGSGVPVGWTDLGNGNSYDPTNDIIYYADGSYSTWDANDRETVHYADYDYIENADGTFTEAWRDGSITTVDANGNVLESMDVNGNVVQGEGPGGSVSGGGAAGPRQNVPSGPGVVQASNGVNWAQAAAALVAGLVAYQKAGGLNPMLGNSQRVGTSVVTPNPNGTITTRYANGQTTISKMPVGQPYVMPDGSTVVNNGDNTITTVRANGTATRSTIPNIPASGGVGGTLGGMSNQTMLMLGLGAVALFMLSSKKGKG